MLYRKAVIVFGFLLMFVFVGAGCTKGIPKDVAARLRPVQIEWWGVNEMEEEVQPILDEYRKLHQNVSVTYRRFRFDEYERRLLNALAEGDFKGPDIFALPSSWTRKYRSKLLPAPRTVMMPFQELRGSVKKELFAELRTTRLPAPQELSNTFLDAVIADAVLETEPVEGTTPQPAIFGLPLAVDTLVLYANRDLLNAAGIPEPAKTWTELQIHIPRLTKLDAQGKLVQSGAAIGTGRNVQRSFDVLSLLMMQNGAVMATPDGEVRFQQIPASLAGRQSPPGIDALLYYTDFANPQKLVFTWNDEQPDSLEAFLQGRAAYFFGYSYHLPIIRARAPRINLSVTGAPHIAAAVDPTTGTVIGSDVIEGNQPVAINMANFWLETVSERTKYPNESWDLVHFMTTKVPVVQQYLATAARPTALRSLVAAQLQDPTLKVFAAQLLSSRTWYHGRNPEAAENAFHDLIADVLRGADPVRALQLAAEKVAQTL
ncbi:extracellular solute-binding protein [Candidatus Uhrbacteria bacterium]|nr:extracellular solute-binding protein [Candidatus Uhrbacteria bacterium]